MSPRPPKTPLVERLPPAVKYQRAGREEKREEEKRSEEKSGEEKRR